MATADSPEARVVGQNRARAILFFVLAGLAGVAGIVLFVQYMDRIKGALPRAAAQTTPVVVAAMDVPIAVRLEERHLALARWPKDNVPEGSFRELKQVMGRTVQQSMVKGEPLLRRRLADEKHGKGMAALVDKGMRAMAVKVDAVVGVAGFVQPGDYVDVITTMTPDTETEEELDNEAAKISKIILQNIKVLAVGEHLTTEGRKPVKVKVVTLAVTPEESERLALGSQHGKIQLTMRSRVDQEEALTAGVTPVKLLSPDQGAEPEAPAPEERAQRRYPRQRKRDKEKEEEEEKKPEAPVVEILRGTKVEERKLRPTGPQN